MGSADWERRIRVGVSKVGPKSQRERNLLNVVALSPKLQPLSRTLGIFDLSQGINRTQVRADGAVPVMATNAVMWAVQDGEDR